MRISGPISAKLGNAVSDAINAALKAGMECDVAACVVAQVAADYWRIEYGIGSLDDLAGVVRDRGAMPLPSGETT